MLHTHCRSYYSVLVGWCGYYFIHMCASSLPSSLGASEDIWHHLQVTHKHTHTQLQQLLLMTVCRGVTGLCCVTEWPSCWPLSLSLAESLPLSRSTRSEHQVFLVSSKFTGTTGDSPCAVVNCGSVFLLVDLPALRQRRYHSSLLSFLGYDVTLNANDVIGIVVWCTESLKDSTLWIDAGLSECLGH